MEKPYKNKKTSTHNTEICSSSVQCVLVNVNVCNVMFRNSVLFINYQASVVDLWTHYSGDLLFISNAKIHEALKVNTVVNINYHEHLQHCNIQELGSKQ